MDLTNPDEARKYIKKNSNNKVSDSDLGIQVENGRVKYATKKKITVNHVEMAETITKFIAMTPKMHILSRKIMTMKIVNPGMTTTQVGLALGLRDHEVTAYETDGKNRVKDFMRVAAVGDVIDTFHSNKGALNPNQRFVEKLIHKTSPLIRQ